MVPDKRLSLSHVVDRSIGQEEQDRVDARLNLRLNVQSEFIEQGSEKCRPHKIDSLYLVLVSLVDALDACDVWVGLVAIKGEAVAHGVQTHEARCTSEAKHGEHLVLVVWLNDITHVKEGLLVRIVATIAHIVEATWLRFQTIACSEVDSCDEGDLPARSQVVKETRAHEDLHH